MFTGIDWDSRQEEWVGSRPCTADGLPLIGVTRSPRVHVAGGHGMWGITLGPLTGKYVADSLDRRTRLAADAALRPAALAELAAASAPRRTRMEEHLPNVPGTEAQLPKRTRMEKHLPKRTRMEEHLPKRTRMEEHLPKRARNGGTSVDGVGVLPPFAHTVGYTTVCADCPKRMSVAWRRIDSCVADMW